jgi:hypothetical protein
MRNNINDILSLLIDSVISKSGRQLVDTCVNLEMIKQEFIEFGFDSTFPEFDRGYLYFYTTDNKETSRLEILERENEILQTGIQIVYKSVLFTANFKKDFQIAKIILDKYYGTGSQMNVGKVETINYGDGKTICYLSKLKMNGKNVLTIRIGNALLWNK